MSAAKPQGLVHSREIEYCRVTEPVLVSLNTKVRRTGNDASPRMPCQKLGRFVDRCREGKSSSTFYYHALAPRWFETSNDFGFFVRASDCLRLRSRTTFNRFENLHVPRAPTQIPRERVANFCFRRVGIPVKQRLCRNQETRRADTALQSSLVDKLLLQWMQS